MLSKRPIIENFFVFLNMVLHYFAQNFKAYLKKIMVTFPSPFESQFYDRKAIIFFPELKLKLLARFGPWEEPAAFGWARPMLKTGRPGPLLSLILT